MVFLPNGLAKKIRDCCVGDEVRTLKGTKRIARIWKMDPHNTPMDVEVTCLDGVWITSHHPVISSNEWVYPSDLQPTAPWQKRKHVMPDMYNFELEGHDDTLLLWEAEALLLVAPLVSISVNGLAMAFAPAGQPGAATVVLSATQSSLKVYVMISSPQNSAGVVTQRSQRWSGRMGQQSLS